MTIRRLLIGLLCLVAVATVPAGAATSGSVVGANVLSATTLTTTGCAQNTPNVTDFGLVTPGATVVTSLPCVVDFGSSNDTARLRLLQQDGDGSAMWRSPDGTLDSAFDGDAAMPGYPGNGLVRTVMGTVSDAFDAVTQPDGRLVMVGNTRIGGDDRFMVARYLTNGTLDTTFDGDATMPGYPGNGVVTTNVRAGATVERAYSVAIDASNRLVVAGRGGSGADDMAITRYLPDGTLDVTFDGPASMPGYPGNGIVVLDVATAFDEAHAVLVRPDGRIVVAGTSVRAAQQDFSILQLLDDGSWDTAFDGDAMMPLYPGNGKVVTPIGASGDRAYSAALQANGQLVVGGVSDVGAARNLAIARYSPTGTLDTSLDGDGIATAATGSTNDNYFGGIAITASGSIYQAGSWLGGGSPGIAVAKYTSTGGLDPTFDGDATSPGYPGNGIVRTPISANYFTTHEVLLLPDGELMVVGDSDGAQDGFVLQRLRSDGTLDTTFSSDGIDVRDLTGSDDSARAVTLGVDGRVIAAGHLGTTAFGLLGLDSVRIGDFDSGTNDWTSAGSVFGACLDNGVDLVATWAPKPGCSTATSPGWNAIARTASDPTATIATTATGEDAARANVHFGFRVPLAQAPGRYVAPVRFEVVAPM